MNSLLEAIDRFLHELAEGRPTALIPRRYDFEDTDDFAKPMAYDDAIGPCGRNGLSLPDQPGLRRGGNENTAARFPRMAPLGSPLQSENIRNQSSRVLFHEGRIPWRQQTPIQGG